MAKAPSEETVEGKDGNEIFFRCWRPDGPPSALVVICHGVNSHSGQYDWTARQLADTGFAVYALDLRGRGKSSGERFFVGDVEDYVGDLATMIALAKAREPGLAVFLLGHSAGGVVSCVYTLEHQAEIDGLICESFAFRVPAPGVVLSVIKGLSHVAPHLPVLRLHNEDFSRDPEAVRALNADPLIAGEVLPASTVLAGSEFFYQHAGSPDKTLKLYEGHYHDLFNDYGKEEVMLDTTQWIRNHLPLSHRPGMGASPG